MKKLFLIAALFFVYSVNAQSIIQLNPDFRPTENNTSIPVSRDARDVTVTWLADDAEEANSFGAGDIGSFMEFTSEDILNFNSTGRQITKVKEINFYLNADHYSSITSCKLVILQGNNFYSATQVFSQDVPVANLGAGWNNINLTTPFNTIDPTKNLYIGYRVVHTANTFPVSVAVGREPKQAWFRSYTSSGESSNNLTSQYYLVFMLKALVETEDTPANEIALQSLDMDRYFVAGDDIKIEGTVKNLGTQPITSFEITYDINGTETDESFTGLNILPGATYDLISDLTYESTQSENLLINVAVSLPNGVQDSTFNNSSQTVAIIASEREARKVLHEGFTSSTCGYCKDANEHFKTVIQAADPDKWTCIKYQMNFPGSGDPYYTAEAGTRFNYYGLTGAPSMIVEGIYDINIGAYNVTAMNQLAAVPAAAKMSSQGTVTGKKLDLNIKLEPVVDFSFANDVRLFAAIVEKGTKNNVKTNGEVNFIYVMKAFMSDVNGKPVTDLTIGQESSHDFSYEFNGGYRLPRTGQAANIINPAIEHSVENFDYLMFVYWLQDVRTGEVFQSGTFDPRPDLISVNETEMFPVTVYPNPAMNYINVQSDVPFTRLTLVNMMGQTVKEVQPSDNNYHMNLEGITKGIYVLRIESTEGVTTKKISVQ